MDSVHETYETDAKILKIVEVVGGMKSWAKSIRLMLLTQNQLKETSSKPASLLPDTK